MRLASLEDAEFFSGNEMPHRGNLFDSVVFLMEARAGVEPTYTDLQRLGGLN